jgi:drug/metabolite transporter (DMT)-like permease
MLVQTTTIYLVLLAAVLHALWNTLVKTSSNGFLKLTLINTFIGVFGLLLLPWTELPSGKVWYFLTASILVHIAYNYLLAFSYRIADLSFVYPIARGTGPLFVALFSALLVGENLTGHSIIGVFIISLGVILLSYRSFKKGSPELRAVIFSLLTGLTIASYSVLDGLGVRLVASPITYIAYQFIAEGIILFAIGLMKQPKELLSFAKDNWKLSLAGAFMASAAYGIVMWAMASTEIYFVSALRETSVIFAAIIGALFLKESFGRIRIFCACLVALGVVILKMGVG